MSHAARSLPVLALLAVLASAVAVGSLAAARPARGQEPFSIETRRRALRLQQEGRYVEAAALYAAEAESAEARGDAEAAARCVWLQARSLRHGELYEESLAALSELLRRWPDAAVAVDAREAHGELQRARTSGFRHVRAHEDARRARAGGDSAGARAIALAALEADDLPDGARGDLVLLAARCAADLQLWDLVAVEAEAAHELIEREEERERAHELADFAHRYIVRRRIGIAALIAAFVLASVPPALLVAGPARRDGTRSLGRVVAITVALVVGLAAAGALLGPALGTWDDEGTHPVGPLDALVLVLALAPAPLLAAVLGDALARRRARHGPLLAVVYAVALLLALVTVYLWLADMFPALGLSGGHAH